MAHPRVYAPSPGTPEHPNLYQCANHIVSGQKVLGDVEKEQFRALMRRYETFCGCTIVSYSILDDHFQLLIEVPEPPGQGISDEELLRRMAVLYPVTEVNAVRRSLERTRKDMALGLATEVALAGIRDRYTRRMHNISELMKSLTRCFSAWYNGRHKRRGTLWQGRFSSLLVEHGDAAQRAAAYIDLAPVREGIVEDPADFRWSSYGEACGEAGVGGSEAARAGICRMWLEFGQEGRDAARWKDEVEVAYRVALLQGAAACLQEQAGGKGMVTLEVAREGMNPEKVREELEKFEKSGKGSLFASLGWKTRHYAAGVALGSLDFVQRVFEGCREHFGASRRIGPCELRGRQAETNAGRLYCLRNLSKEVDG